MRSAAAEVPVLKAVEEDSVLKCRFYSYLGGAKSSAGLHKKNNLLLTVLKRRSPNIPWGHMRKYQKAEGRGTDKVFRSLCCGFFRKD